MNSGYSSAGLGALLGVNSGCSSAGLGALLKVNSRYVRGSLAVIGVNSRLHSGLKFNKNTLVSHYLYLKMIGLVWLTGGSAVINLYMYMLA